MKTNYSEKIFGGVLDVKKLFVNQLIFDRVKAGLSHEELDAMLDMGADWPKCREIEANPRLFTYRFHHHMTGLRIDTDLTILMTVPEIEEKIEEFLQPAKLSSRIGGWMKKLLGFPSTLDQAVAELKDSALEIRGTAWISGSDSGQGVASVLMNQFSVNSIPPEAYAYNYIFHCIMEEIGDITV